MKIDIPYSIHYDQTMKYVPGDRVFNKRDLVTRL